MSSEIDLNNSVGRKSNNVQSDAKVCECIVFYELDRMSYQKKKIGPVWYNYQLV